VVAGDGLASVAVVWDPQVWTSSSGVPASLNAAVAVSPLTGMLDVHLRCAAPGTVRQYRRFRRCAEWCGHRSISTGHDARRLT
jgi:hypothetical protein